MIAGVLPVFSFGSFGFVPAGVYFPQETVAAERIINAAAVNIFLNLNSFFIAYLMISAEGSTS